MNLLSSVLRRFSVALFAAGVMVFSLARNCAGQGFEPGTLAYHLSTNAAGRASGHAGNYDSMKALSGWGYAEYTITNLDKLTNAVWSTNFWLRGVQGLSATCIGFSNGLGGQGLITMVSPRHYLFSTHMHPEGYRVAFLDTNNTIHWRRTLDRVDVANDTSVGILNEDLPASVGYLPVLPANYANVLPVDNVSTLQGIGMNQDMAIFSQPMNFGSSANVRWSSQRAVPMGVGTNWNVAIRAGDSSDPEMLLIGNQLVLVSHNFAVNGGPNYAGQISAINEAMHSLSKKNHVRSDYRLTEISLKNWAKGQ